ncbi:DUF6176 family protein [Halostella pelagica]|uniref:DUF6176 family protein n=1 Tax=Halostella pelagica TaxID=2583824 RepID=UPI0010812AA8|nr:DUF6176 family protein [Halostella pelagica]
MVDAILSKRRVDPEKVDQLRDYFDSLDDRQELFERGLDLEEVYTEAAFLQDDGEGPVLYYYIEQSDDFPPELDREDIDDQDLLELSAEHEAVLNEVCLEPARNGDEERNRFETLFFASTIDRRA